MPFEMAAVSRARRAVVRASNSAQRKAKPRFTPTRGTKAHAAMAFAMASATLAWAVLPCTRCRRLR
ncbi:hypothetical protein [Kibdelosporangium philippinense]|uniref:hypothetical protein n=1 Tax=Kibdelosporangium philippinense TaxID=211113 RepID=UPI0036183419